MLELKTVALAKYRIKKRKVIIKIDYININFESISNAVDISKCYLR